MNLMDSLSDLCYTFSIFLQGVLNMKKRIALILSILMVVSFAACSSDPGSASADEAKPSGSAQETAADAEPEPDDFPVVDAASLPSTVDLRDYNGKCYVTSVKSQRFGDCWTFSLAGAAEIAYLFANDMGVPAGQVNDQVNFSEKYIAWYLFHGITADDVTPGRVRASQVGEGFDLSEVEETHEFAAYNIGGECVHYADLYCAGFGPVDESVSVKGEYPFSYDPSRSELEWWMPLNSAYRCAPATGFFRGGYQLPSPASHDESGAYVFSEEGLNAIRSELFQGHGVSLGLSASGGYNADTKSVYHSGDVQPNHAVTVVGYDDHYPKERFTITKSDGSEIKGTTPPQDGAFIIKNSWGIVNSEEDGYFYLSYYDHSIVTPLSYEFDSDSRAKHADYCIDQYDLMMTSWCVTQDYDDEVKTANVFDAEQDGSLYQIAYKTADKMTEVKYEIYKDVKDGDPTSGTLIEKGVNRHLYPGSYRVDLRGEYPLKKGEKYAVVLTMKRERDEGGDMVYTELEPYSTDFSEGLTVRGIINPGESYRYSGGRWQDLSDIKNSLIDRAFRQGAEELSKKITFTKISLTDKETFTVDNYPIKAILAPAG